MQHYVNQHDGSYWIAGTRVSLDSVVFAFLESLSPESIVDSFEALTLEQVFGALAYYLKHRPEIDEVCHRLRDSHPLLYQKLEAARQRTVTEPA